MFVCVALYGRTPSASRRARKESVSVCKTLRPSAVAFGHFECAAVAAAPLLQRTHCGSGASWPSGITL